MPGGFWNGVIIIGIILICIFSVKSYLKKLKHGCCGGESGEEEKIKVSDRNRRNYQHELLIEVEGMTCGNCATRVENALNRIDGVWAKVDLSKKRVDVYTKQQVEEAVLRNAIRSTGYAPVKFEHIR